MPNVTINGMTTTACSHKVVQTSAGDFPITLEEIADARPDTPEELRDAFIAIVRHQYLTVRTGPPSKNHAQAMNALVGFTVRM